MKSRIKVLVDVPVSMRSSSYIFACAARLGQFKVVFSQVAIFILRTKLICDFLLSVKLCFEPDEGVLERLRHVT